MLHVFLQFDSLFPNSHPSTLSLFLFLGELVQIISLLNISEVITRTQRDRHCAKDAQKIQKVNKQIR